MSTSMYESIGSTANKPLGEMMLFWRYITSSIDQLLATLEGLDAQEIN